MKKIGILLLFCCFHIAAKAQYWELGAAVGPTNIKSDVTPELRMQNTRFGLGAFARYNLSSEWAFKASAFFGTFAGADSLSSNAVNKARNVSFSSAIREVNATLEYNFFNFRAKSRYQTKMTPYAFIGLGFSSLSTRRFPASVEESGAFALTVPMGVGIKRAINNRMQMSVDFTSTRVFSDRLDAVVNDPPNNQGFYSPGQWSRFDSYYFVSFSLSYRFISILCPRGYENTLFAEPD